MAIILTQAEVRTLLPMGTCIDLMGDALEVLGRGEAINPLRTGVKMPDGAGLLGMMPGWMATPPALGIKVVAVFPGNHGTDFDSHQGLVALFDTTNGVPLVIMDASEVTAIRTAAASGLATRLLARETASDLAILGSGVQASTHLEAMLEVRKIERVRVYSPNESNRNAFAARASKRYALDVVAVDSAKACVEGADIICTATSSREPVLCGDWIAPGAHINAAGACFPASRELDTAAVVLARLFVDRRESAVNEAGDFLIARKEGAITDDKIEGEIGELLLGTLKGRQSDDEVTLFKSLGIAVEDLAAAHHVWRCAVEQEVGTIVELGGVRE
jgi:alanine dehydrogenase